MFWRRTRISGASFSRRRWAEDIKAQPTSWSLSGTVQGRLEQLKQKTKCHICKMPGHWKRECPKRRDKPSTSQSTRTAGVKEAMITDDGIDKPWESETMYIMDSSKYSK